MNDINNVDYLNVKIKKEKLTPPREIDKNNDKNNENVLIINKITNNINKNNDEIVDNDKKQIEPVKSSNEILAELFKVFNAPPPDIIINKDETNGKLEKTKKHKEKKHKKRSSPDDKGKRSKDKDKDKDTDKSLSKKVKKKKRSKDEDKKHQRHNNHHEPDGSTELVELVVEPQEKDDEHIIKKKKRHHHHHREHKKKRKKYDDEEKISKKDLNVTSRNNKEKVNTKTTNENVTSTVTSSTQSISLNETNKSDAEIATVTSITTTTSAAATLPTSTATATTTVSSTSTSVTNKPNKIIIKCLKNSTIFDASEKLAEEKLLNKYNKNDSDSNNNDDNDKNTNNDVEDDNNDNNDNNNNNNNNSDKESDSLSSILSLSDEETYLNEAYNNSKRLAAAAAAAAAASGVSSSRLTDSSLANGHNSNYDNYYYSSGHNNDCDRNDRYRYSKNYRSKSGERDSYRSSYRSERSRVTDYYDVKKGRWSGESSSRRRKSRSRSYSRSRSRSRSSDCYIDKKKLLDIARKNAISMLKNGTLPGTQNMGADDKEKVLAKMKYNGKTIEELTEYCKKLSNGEKLIELSDVSDGDDSDHDKDGNQRPFNHPFILKDRGPIVMNIKNSTPITPRTAEQTKALLMQYPVSSGQDHRRNENEWKPVLPAKKVEPTTPNITKQVPKVTPTTIVQQKPVNIQNLQPITYPIMAQKTNIQPPITQQQKLQHLQQQQEQQQQQYVTPLPAPPQIPQVLMTLTQSQITAPSAEFKAQMQHPPPTVQNTSIFLDNQVFPDSSMGANLDVSTIISQRLNAMRKLQENPQDPSAIKLLFDTQKDMSAWATSKFTPGQFIGSTGANILSAKELSAGYQPWAKKDQFTSTTPLSGGMGMHLLQKMGWRPGEGLGKDKTGSLQPLLLEVKLDKKGLVAYEENPNKRNKNKKQQGNLNVNNIINNNNNSNLLSINNNNNNHNSVKNNNNNNNNNNAPGTQNVNTNNNNNNNLLSTVQTGGSIATKSNNIINTNTNDKPLLSNIGTNLIGNNVNSTKESNLNGNINNTNNNSNNNSINNYKSNNNNQNCNNTNGNNEVMPLPTPLSHGNVTTIPNNGNINMNALEEKHPVSLLGELSAKRKWGLPFYEVVLESGPGHSKQFMFKVTVNGIQYQPQTPSNNKKEAKATAAKVCLQHMGILNS